MAEDLRRVDPKVFQTALLDEIAERLLKLEKLTAQQYPEGIVEPLHTFTATTTPRVVTPPIKDKRWFSVNIINDGAADCWVVVNTEKSSTMPMLIRDTEVTNVDMKSAKIVDLLLWTDAGTASLRIRGVR